MRIHILQHISFETAGTIIDWAKEQHHIISHTYLYEKSISYPKIEDFDMLVVMGGTMGVYDEAIFEWLKAEKEFIKTAILANKIVLGICLGSQLLAEVLGAKVYQNHTKEIGFFPITKTELCHKDSLFSHIPENWLVFHWHGDTFDLPEDVTHLFSSPACKHQAFRKGNCIGLQFHPEIDKTLLNAMVEFEKHELISSEYVQSEQEILADGFDKIIAANRKYLYEFLDKLCVKS
jgi:GMP synthase-like glutamine amidotransferase